MSFTFSMFRGKIEKVVKNGGPKVIKIHEKWSLGRPRVDFWIALIFGSRVEKSLII